MDVPFGQSYGLGAMTPEQIATTLVSAMRTPLVPTFTVTLRDGRSIEGFPCGQRHAGTPNEAYVFMLDTGNQVVIGLSLIRRVASQ